MINNVIALVGNPNTGKTTFFNTIAKAEEHVGNWHGVTVEYKEKKLKTTDGNIVILTDLPGTYSLTSYSFEEAVTRDYLYGKNCNIINICDANNLGRNLLLTLELIELGYRPIVCINMANELKKNGISIDIKKLEQMLGTKVFLINAQNKADAKKVFEYMTKCTCEQHVVFPYQKTCLKLFDSFEVLKTSELTDFQKLKILECDEYILKQVYKSDQKIFDIKSHLINNKTLDKVIETKYQFIRQIIQNCVRKSNTKKVYGYSKIDKVVLNKWLAIPVFITIFALIFFLTFGPIGSFLSNEISLFFQTYIFGPICDFVAQKTNNMFVLNFLTEALFGSISSLISFLPQIAIMFLCLFVLEDSGYMSRLAFWFEDFFKKVGLSGKSVFTLLLGFGCSTTASLTCRGLEDKNGKIKTAILSPYISCSAKLPLYAIICNAFFPNLKFVVVAGLYLLGVFVALIVSYFLNKKFLPSKQQSFIMEMPPYRFPSTKRLVKNLYLNTKQFLLRVGTILLSFSCIIWLFQNCNFKFEYCDNGSILDTISSFVAPMFSPLGFGSAGAVTCLLCGFVAKEIIVSTIALVNGCGSDSMSQITNSLLLTSSAFCLTPASALSFLTFSLLYVPCVSTVSVFVKEIGKKWTLFACLLQFAISYLLSFVVYKVSLYFWINGFVSGILSLVVFVLFVLFICFVAKNISQKSFCKYCPNKKNCK